MVYEWGEHPRTNYNRLILDRNGVVVKSTQRQKALERNIVGHDMKVMLRNGERVAFLKSIRTAIATQATMAVNYHVDGNTYVAVIDPIDRDKVCLHEQRAEIESRERVVAVLMGYVRRRVG